MATVDPSAGDDPSERPRPSSSLGSLSDLMINPHNALSHT